MVAGGGIACRSCRQLTTLTGPIGEVSLDVSDTTIKFEMTDELISRAVRENSVATLREQVKLRDVLFIAASTALFIFAVGTDSHWAWWLAGLPAAILAVLGLVWLAGYFLLPRQARKRLAHLPHRNVEVHLADAGISFKTATERLEVAWSEVNAIKRRTGFWIVCLRTGTEIPLPVDVLPAEVRSFLESKAPPQQ